MAIPLVLIYELGLLIVGWDALNGADMITLQLLKYLGRTGFLVLNGVLLVAFGVAVAQLRKRNRLNYRYFLPLLLESGIYAVLIGAVMESAHLLGPGALTQSSLLTRLVVSAGAGLHEEVVFRLLMIPAIIAIWRFVPVLGGDLTAPVVAVIVSSVLFSLAHHIVEPFVWTVFWYRTIAGAIFAALFVLRGFAVAAYTHAIYDVWVLIFLA